jgi:fatty-acyl-CoA synthase
MSGHITVNTPSAYSYPLLIKQLLLTARPCFDKEIVYRDLKRIFSKFRRRIGRRPASSS